MRADGNVRLLAEQRSVLVHDPRTHSPPCADQPNLPSMPGRSPGHGPRKE
ncbi:hypothetical protein ACWCQS_38725 [Streptomyces sp. NPDC002076]